MFYGDFYHVYIFSRLREAPPSIFQKRIDDFNDEDDQCGLTADRILSKRIIGGKQALFGEFPWQVYIKISSYQCGGVLGRIYE